MRCGEGRLRYHEVDLPFCAEHGGLSRLCAAAEGQGNTDPVSEGGHQHDGGVRGAAVYDPLVLRAGGESEHLGEYEVGDPEQVSAGDPACEYDEAVGLR